MGVPWVCSIGHGVGGRAVVGEERVRRVSLHILEFRKDSLCVVRRPRVRPTEVGRWEGRGRLWNVPVEMKVSA